MIKDLIKFETWFDNKYIETFSFDVQFDVQFDGSEIIFSWCIYIGFGEIKHRGKRVLNACDVKTNINGFYKELLYIKHWINLNYLKVS